MLFLLYMSLIAEVTLVKQILHSKKYYKIIHSEAVMEQKVQMSNSFKFDIKYF